MPRDHRSVLKDATPSSTEGQRLCAREAWCTGYRLVPTGDGTSRREPGLSYQAFCAADTALIAANLSAETGLPAAWLRLEADLGDPARRGEMIRVPFGPRMLLSEYYDLLMRRIAEVLCSHERRVRKAARLVQAGTATRSAGLTEALEQYVSDLRAGDADAAAWALQDIEVALSRADAMAARRCAGPPNAATYSAVERAASTLETHLSVLLALPETLVLRHVPSTEAQAAEDPRAAAAPILEVWQSAGVLASRDGTSTLLASISGAHAGLEILDLHRRCLTALGEVATHPELFDGVPCRVSGCDTRGLERAEPPSDPNTPADHSRCPGCGDRMSLTTFREWVEWYKAWAESAGPIICQRCVGVRRNGVIVADHAGCIYDGCECAAEGHQGAALTPRATLVACVP